MFVTATVPELKHRRGRIFISLRDNRTRLPPMLQNVTKINMFASLSSKRDPRLVLKETVDLGIIQIMFFRRSCTCRQTPPPLEREAHFGENVALAIWNLNVSEEEVYVTPIRK